MSKHDLNRSPSMMAPRDADVKAGRERFKAQLARRVEAKAQTVDLANRTVTLDLVPLVHGSKTLVVLANSCHNPAGSGGGQFCGGIKLNLPTSVQVVATKLGTSIPMKGQVRHSDYKAGNAVRMGYDLIPDKTVPKIVEIQSKTPGFEDLAGRTDRKVLTEIAERQSVNVEDAFDQAMAVDGGTGTAVAHAGWYPWVNRWAHGEGERLNLKPEAVMGAAAVLSPGAAWENNVAWARATAEFVSNEKNITVQKEWVAAQAMAAEASYKDKIETHNEAQAKLVADSDGTYTAKPFTGKKPDASEYEGLVGKTVADLTPLQAAVVLRGAHEAFGSAIHQLGGGAGLGDPKNKARPQSLENFAKAISILRNPSTENIDAELGNSHKVRSFYNNMRDPFDTKFAEVTVDSHHIGLVNGIAMPGENKLSTSLYGGTKAASTGLSGTYPLAVEATRIATDQINKKHGTNYTPAQIQSITWEYHRAAWPNRTPSIIAQVSAARTAFAKSGKTASDRANMLAAIENIRQGPGKGPSLEQMRAKFRKELAKGEKGGKL